MDEIALALVALAFVLAAPIMAIVALVKISNLRAEVAQLRRRVEQGSAVVAPAAAPALPAEPAPAAVEPPAADTEQVPVEEGPALPPPFEPMPAPALAPAAMSKPAVAQLGLEQRLGARAFIWIGAITLALSAVFLVRYSIEEGWLSPEVRVILAALFGFGLIGAAEKVRARDDRVAQAMAAAGAAALYGALFAAVALYEMISKPMAGIGAAALTAFAIGVSLRHGVLVAALAFIGGFASPAIIGSDNPNTPVLFGYLLAIASGTLSVIRYRGWWTLGWGVLAGSALWVVAWMAMQGDGLVWVAAFLVAVGGLYVWTTWRRMAESENPSFDVAALVWSALGLSGVLLVAIIVQDNGKQELGWIALAVHGAGLYVLARTTPRFQYVAGGVPLLSLAALALWWGMTGGTGPDWNADRFAWLTILLGGVYAAGAFALMWNAGRPGFWAALSVATALAHFLLCWYVLRLTSTGTPWGFISLGLAVPFLVGAERLVRWRESMPGATEALGFLAAGVSFFIAAAIPLELSRHWITVAYAIELAAVAWIANWLNLWAMRQICWGLLAVVVARFVLNPFVLSYPVGVTPVFNWILWSYGISILSLGIGRNYLRGSDERLVRAIEATMALLVFTLLTLEVHSLFQGNSDDLTNTSFIERASYVLVWGAFALGCLWLARLRLDPIMLWAWRLSGGLAAAVVIFVQVLIANPVFEPSEVGSLPILNGLLVAYAIPAAMAALASRWIDVEQSPPARRLAEIVASVLAFVYVSMEVRHFFDPGFQREPFDVADIELYTYSFVWLLFGVALLALGFWRQSAAPRHAGMALVCIVVAKVFLIDMAGLQGLLRVLSFLGLGAALLGLGYAYRRLGFEQRQPG
jgi:uncharacterized membrane protein